MNTIIQNESLQFMKQNIGKHKKDRFQLILEPLQVMVMFVFLSKMPVGTKISIHENIVYLQESAVFQGMIRWFNNDNKDDLYALYQVFQRYHYFYVDHHDVYPELFKMIKYYAKLGIENLIETYKKTEKHSLLHSLHICKLLLQKPDLLSTLNEHSEQGDLEPIQNVDVVFKKVTELYDDNYFHLLYYILKQLIGNKGDPSDILQSYMSISKNYFEKITQWIHKNVIF